MVHTGLGQGLLLGLWDGGFHFDGSGLSVSTFLGLRGGWF